MKRTHNINSKKIGTYAQRISFFEYFYVFVLIIYAGLASKFVRAGSFTDNIVGYPLPIILSGILAIKWKIKIDKQFYGLIGCLFIYFIAITIKYNELHLSIFTYYLFLFFIVYATVKVLGLNFFSIYELLMYYLAIVALAMWGVQTILRGDTLNNYLSKIPGIQEFSNVSGDGGLNAIIYSVQSTSSSILYNFSIPRNAGFAWEPGGFAVYLCLAIFINLFMINSSNNKLNLHFWVLLVALVSTQSTTGYSIFIVLILFYYLNKKTDTIVLIIPLLLTAAIFVFSLPFMSNKIEALTKETDDVDYIVWKSIGNESNSAPQRFTSFFISYRDFYNNPILGNANITGKSWYDKIGANISPISGIGNLLANFGIVGFLFFIISSFKSSVFFSKYFNYKMNVLLFIILLLITISYSVIFLPLLMCFWMYSLFGKNSTDQKSQLIYDSSLKNLVSA
ncbi:MAG: hypothetical protein ACRDE8_13065 [Ginsengibacter sp.]